MYQKIAYYYYKSSEYYFYNLQNQGITDYITLLFKLYYLSQITNIVAPSFDSYGPCSS